MNPNNTYIKITEDISDDNYSPSEEELLLDKFDDMEYNTPYSYSDEDLFDVGGIIEAGGIFDDR